MKKQVTSFKSQVTSKEIIFNWFRAFLTCSLLLVTCHLVFADSKDPQAIHAFNEGAKLFNDKQFAQALPYFDQAIAKDGNFIEAYYARGTCRHYLKQTTGALDDINRTIHLDPSFLDAYAIRGIIYYEMENWNTALSDFNYVLARKPNDAQSLLARGVISLKKEQLSQAKHDFKTYLALRPDDPLAPRLRKLLQQLSGLSESETAATPSVPSTQNPTAPGSYTRTPKRGISEAVKQMGDELLLNSYALSDKAGQMARRRDHVEVTGDKYGVTKRSASSSATVIPSGSSGHLQIVDPSNNR